MADPREGEAKTVWRSPCERFHVVREVVGFGIEVFRVKQGERVRITCFRLDAAQKWTEQQPQ